MRKLDQLFGVPILSEDLPTLAIMRAASNLPREKREQVYADLRQRATTRDIGEPIIEVTVQAGLTQ